MERLTRNIGKIIVLLVVLLLILGIIPPGVSIMSSVPAGCTGILTTYGKVEDVSLDSGLHFKLPWQRIVVMDNRVQVVHISSGVSNATTHDTAETKDQQLIPVFDFEIQYQLDANTAYMVYSTYGEKYENVLLISNCLQTIKETFAMYEASEIVTAKGLIPDQIANSLSEIIEPLGIHIIKVNMVTYDFSPEYTAILEERALLNANLENTRLQQQNETIAAQTRYDVAVKESEQKAETARIEAENANAIALAKAQAKAESDRVAADNAAYVTRTQAEADRDARLAAAEAEKAELEAKSAGLNDYVIQQEWISKWDGKLIPSFGGSTFSFGDITDVIKQYVGDKSE